MSTLDEQIGKRLKIARLIKYKSARSFAKECKIPESTYSQHENGKRSLSPTMILFYTEKLNILPGWLITGNGEMTAETPYATTTNQDGHFNKIINNWNQIAETTLNPSPQNINGLFKFIHLAEKLKSELRHSWLSSGRQESVAEHCWRLALMVMLVSPYLKQKINLEKALKMALIHDIAESITGDFVDFNYQTPTQSQQKLASEKKAIEEIATMLNDTNGNDIQNLWLEFEAQNSLEAKIVKFLDKLECKIQHNQASINSWSQAEKDNLLFYEWLDQAIHIDPFLKTLKDHVKQKTQQKAMQAKAQQTSADTLV